MPYWDERQAAICAHCGHRLRLAASVSALGDEPGVRLLVCEGCGAAKHEQIVPKSLSGDAKPC